MSNQRFGMGKGQNFIFAINCFHLQDMIRITLNVTKKKDVYSQRERKTNRKYGLRSYENMRIIVLCFDSHDISYWTLYIRTVMLRIHNFILCKQLPSYEFLKLRMARELNS